MEDIEDRKRRAERGWIAQPPTRPASPYQPGQETKWYLMMGARRLLEEKVARERALAQDFAARHAGLRKRDPQFTEGAPPGACPRMQASGEGEDRADAESADS